MRNDATITFRLPEEEKLAIVEEAYRQQMYVGDFIRRACIAAMAQAAVLKIMPRRSGEQKPNGSDGVVIVETKGWKKPEGEDAGAD